MKKILITDLKVAFEHMEIKIIEGYNSLKTNEIGYEFTEENKLQLKYQSCNHNRVSKAIRIAELLSDEINFKCCNYSYDDTVHSICINF